MGSLWWVVGGERLNFKTAKKRGDFLSDDLFKLIMNLSYLICLTLSIGLLLLPPSVCSQRLWGYPSSFRGSSRFGSLGRPSPYTSFGSRFQLSNRLSSYRSASQGTRGPFVEISDRRNNEIQVANQLLATKKKDTLTSTTTSTTTTKVAQTKNKTTRTPPVTPVINANA